MSADWTNVVWSQGITILAERDQVLQGANDTGFFHSIDGLSIYSGETGPGTFIIQVEALLIKSSSSDLVNMTKGASGSSTVDVSVWNLMSSSFVNLAPFPFTTQSGGTLQVSLTPLYGYPSGTVDVKDAAQGLRNEVFGNYLMWYGNPLGPSGQWSHWGNPQGTGITNSTINNTTDFPLLGVYDSGDPNVISAQMAIAKYSGVDGFLLSWWGIKSFPDDQTSTVLKVADQMGMKIMITVDGLYSRDPNASDVVKELVYIVKNYASDPAYYNQAGAPVIFIYAAWAGPNGEVRSPTFWQDVRTQVEAQVGRVILIGDVLDGTGTPSSNLPVANFALPYLGVFDAIWSYSDIIEYMQGNMQEWHTDICQNLAVGLSPEQTVDQALAQAYAGGQVSAERKFLLYTVTAGSDNTKVASPGVYVNRANGTVYATFWNSAINQSADATAISSWNEWHEGAEIEPSLQYGFTYTDLTRQYAQEYKNTVLPAISPNFSATVQASNTELNLVLNAFGGTPALLTKVEVRSVGTTNPTIIGNFTSYSSFHNSTLAYVVIPYCPSSSAGFSVKVPFQSSGNSSSFEVRVTAYDPSGQIHTLFSGEVISTTANASTTTTTQTSSKSLVSSSSTSASSTSSGSSTSSAGGGIPEFPFQLLAATVVTSLIVAGYLLSRRKHPMSPVA